MARSSSTPKTTAAPQKTSMPAPSSNGPAAPGTNALGNIPREKVAMRAYEKWCQRGQPCDGSDMHDWLAAEQELKAEVSKQTGNKR